MKVRGVVVALTALLVLAIAVPASAGVGLNAYRANAKGLKQLRELKKLGFDLTEGQRRKGVEIVATKAQVRKLRRAGVRAKLIRTRSGRTALKAAAAQAAGGWEVWRPYARTDVAVSGASGNPTANIKTQMENLAAKYPGIAKLETIGHSLSGLPIYAMKVTKDAKKRKDGSRPAVLYSAVQHAREWLAGETERRTLRLFLDNYGKKGTAVGTDGQPVDGVSVEGAHEAGEQARALVHPHLQPRRVRLHVRPAEPPLAEEPARQQRRRADHRRRRRGPEPELPDALELRRRGLEHRHLVRDLSRHGAGVGAGDEGVPVADEQGPLRLQQERPHRGAAAPVAVRVAGGHASRRRAADDGARR